MDAKEKLVTRVKKTLPPPDDIVFHHRETVIFQNPNTGIFQASYEPRNVYYHAWKTCVAAHFCDFNAAMHIRIEEEVKQARILLCTFSTWLKNSMLMYTKFDLCMLPFLLYDFAHCVCISLALMTTFSRFRSRSRSVNSSYPQLLTRHTPVLRPWLSLSIRVPWPNANHVMAKRHSERDRGGSRSPRQC